MAELEPSHKDVYNSLLSAVRSSQAEALARDIELTVARGVVVSAPKSEVSEQSKMFRPMNDKETLAVAIEFLITTLEVPLMLTDAQRTLEAATFSWLSDRPDAVREPVFVGDAMKVDVPTLREFLSEILRLTNELQLDVPEVA